MVIVALVAAAPVFADISGSISKNKAEQAKGSSSCSSGMPCWYTEQAATNSDGMSDTQQLAFSLPVVGGFAGGVFVQNTVDQFGGTTITTRTTGMDAHVPGPGGSTLVGGIGLTQIRAGGGIESGTTVVTKVQVPVRQVGRSLISFEVGQQTTTTPRLRSTNLIFGVTGSMGAGGRAAAAPKRERMQAPQLASARTSNGK